MGRLHAVVMCKHKAVSPLILIESIFIKGAEGTILSAAAKFFTKTDVLPVVKLVLRNFNNVAAVVEMKKTEILADFNSDDPLYRKWELSLEKKFVADVCKNIGCPLPREEGIPFLLDFALNAVVNSYLYNQVEEQDVIPMVKTLADDNAAHIDAGINIINRRCPYRASYVACRLRKPAIPFTEKIQPKCGVETNERLHSLPVSANFSDVVTPLKVALRHRAIRVAIIYEFIVKMKGLREQRQTSDRHQSLLFILCHEKLLIMRSTRFLGT